MHHVCEWPLSYIVINFPSHELTLNDKVIKDVFQYFFQPIFLQTYWNNLRFKVPDQASQQSIHIYETINDKPCTSNSIELSTLSETKTTDKESHSSEVSEVWKSVELKKYDTEGSSSGTWESVQYKEYDDLSEIDQNDDQNVSVKLGLNE